MQEEQTSLLAFLQRPSTLAELQAGPQIFAAPEIQSFVRSASEPNAALRDLAPLLLHSDSFRASALALICGTLVEQGGEASIAIDDTLELMLQQLQRASRDYINKHELLSDEELFLHYPEATRAHYGLPFTLLAAMTMLCREKEKRKALRQRQDVVQLVNEMVDLMDEQEELG